jgi:hypothetical protein
MLLQKKLDGLLEMGLASEQQAQPVLLAGPVFRIIQQTLPG